MDSLKKFFFIILIINLSSCAKTRYMLEQGSGQLKLLWSAKKNEKMLSDPNVTEDVKNKINQIQVYKNHFYGFWDKEPTKIYSKTTILKGKAVTYLVISSKYYEIKPLTECFPFMGCFPYIGFFSKESAMDYRREKEAENYDTYIRPVFAYSTLGYFTDTILSSFFYYQDIELAELIFHELFHTIFFVKDEVDLNENLANYFGKEMAKDYFKDDPNLEKRKGELDKSQLLRKKLVELVQQLNRIYEQEGGAKLTMELAHQKRDIFLKEKFMPDVEAFCRDNKIENCFPLNREWNNASFAAFMTYEKKADKLDMLRDKLNLDLKSFYRYIESEYKEYEEKDIPGKFGDFLFRKL